MYVLSCVVPSLALGVGQVLFVRRLIRCRMARRGRISAMRGILRPTDAQPSAWWRACLCLYGVTSDDLAMLPMLWRRAEPT